MMTSSWKDTILSTTTTTNTLMVAMEKKATTHNKVGEGEYVRGWMGGDGNQCSWEVLY